MKKNKTSEEKVFTLKLTEKEIAIIKAGIEYYLLDDEFGYVLWGTIPGATFGSRDWEYMIRAGAIHKKLKKLSKVKPNYGWWGNISRLVRLCDKEYKKAKRAGNDEWEKIIKESKRREAKGKNQ